MFRKILIPVDLTDKNRRAIEVARDLARQGGGQVTVLHVIETLDVPFEELEDFYQRLEDQARERITTLTEPLQTAGLSVEQRICYGKRAPEIVLYAQDHDIDLIVITSHRLNPDEPGRSWMTISYQVAILSPCPTLILK